MGVGEHILKPVERDDFLARVDAFGRVDSTDSARLEFPPYVFDRRARTVAVRDRPIKLNDAEFDVALSLFERAGRIVTSPLLACWPCRRSPRIGFTRRERAITCGISPRST
ncbi:MAG: DNA-binding response OmpR family regulator [Gammaproteobacteria bacterium]